jgi:hypothetical protein
MRKYRHQRRPTCNMFRLFCGDSGGRNGRVLCGICVPSKLDHYDLWSRPGGPPMVTFRFHVFASSQLLVRANYLDRTLVLVPVPAQELPVPVPAPVLALVKILNTISTDIKYS